MTKELPMLKNVRLLMLVLAQAAVGSAEQNSGEQNIGGWAQAAQSIAGGTEQNI